MKSPLRAITIAVALVMASGTLAAVTVPVASATTDFYTPPAEFDTSPGAIIKSRPTPIFLQIPADPRPFPGQGTTVMYTSKLQDGTPAAVTGTLIEPFAPWNGNGPRPTIVMAPGTIGQGDQCAPSKLFGLPISLDPAKLSIGANYELLFANFLLYQGYRILMTDYIGLGTPGMHTYVNRVEEGHAVLDGARAALQFAKLPSDSPVGFWGYSQGGGATASAAEMASTYAPELNVKATYSGAPPANLSKVLTVADGTLAMGVIGYAINGLLARYPSTVPLIDEVLNPAGKQAIETLSTSCVADTVLRYGFHHTSEWTTSGQSIAEAALSYPAVQEAIDEQTIGRLKPTAPVLVDTGINDDLVPHGQVIDMVDSWRAKGADVQVINDATPPIFPGLVVNHGLPYLFSTLPAYKFLYDRFNAPS
ncbi:lipase family protein [Rhodococcus sp. G-MC3]|uniref:lipase family protein n=1 Tax=Rhodococcus sp. G-MC3 TaxID=3046209 RepID=UPI0024BB3A76|nr:lipase family protein [Rhodococcus sp. G-MC3]MDJ0396639.1 lipase family protein [Rhodococcus sp. G-MC3]